MFTSFLTPERLMELYSATICDRHGERLGPVGHVYVDDGTGHATWATARSGRFGRHDILVPLQGATYEAQRVIIPFDLRTIVEAPVVDVSDRVSPLDEDLLFTYYAAAARAQQEAVAELVSVYQRAAQVPLFEQLRAQRASSAALGECDSRFVSFSTRSEGEPLRTVSHLPVEPVAEVPPEPLATSVPGTVWEGDASDRDFRVHEDILLARDSLGAHAPGASMAGHDPRFDDPGTVPTAGEIVQRSEAQRQARRGGPARPRPQDHERHAAHDDLLG